MIVIKLREAMEAYRKSTGKGMTYAQLAAETHLSPGTIGHMGSGRYNATLDTIERVCRALETTPAELLEMIDDPPTQPVAKRRTSKEKRPNARS